MCLLHSGINHGVRFIFAIGDASGNGHVANPEEKKMPFARGMRARGGGGGDLRGDAIETERFQIESAAHYMTSEAQSRTLTYP